MRTSLASSLALLSAILIGGSAHAAPVAGTGPAFRGPIGLQLYSLRGQFTKNVPLGIKMAAGLGVRDVETAGTYGLEPARLAALLREAGLRPISGHFPFEAFDKEPEKVAADARALGLSYAGCAWIPHEGAFKETDARKAIEVFNRAGAVLRKQGIQLFYHCHGYEFERSGAGFLMDTLMAGCDREMVAFEMDTTWVFFPGQDPAAWLRKYPGRWQLMHLKDLKRGVARGALTGSTDPNNDVPLGSGQLDWPAILKAAAETGVKHYFIEDESAAAPEQIPASLKYLESVRW